MSHYDIRKPFALTRKPSQSRVQVYKKQLPQNKLNTKSCLSLNTFRGSSCSHQSSNIHSLKCFDQLLNLNAKIAKKQQLLYFYIEELVRRRKNHIKIVKQKKLQYQKTLQNFHLLIANQSSRNNSLTHILQSLQANKKQKQKEKEDKAIRSIASKSQFECSQIQVNPKVLVTINRNYGKSKHPEIENYRNKYLRHRKQPKEFVLANNNNSCLFDLTNLNWSRVQQNENQLTLNLSNQSELLIN